LIEKRLSEISFAENLQLDQNACEAIVKLSGGDMRKVLNILESCSLAYKNVTMQAVYDVTGRPSPTDVTEIYNALNSERFDQAL
jgi:replication factor C subunit 3/5